MNDVGNDSEQKPPRPVCNDQTLDHWAWIARARAAARRIVEPATPQAEPRDEFAAAPPDPVAD
jgi:hypothetical protein